MQLPSTAAYPSATDRDVIAYVVADGVFDVEAVQFSRDVSVFLVHYETRDRLYVGQRQTVDSALELVAKVAGFLNTAHRTPDTVCPGCEVCAGDTPDLDHFYADLAVPRCGCWYCAAVIAMSASTPRLI